MDRSPSPDKQSCKTSLKLKKYNTSSDSEDEHLCSDVGHRFHSHAKVSNYNDKMRILNHSKKIRVHGLPDMEFALTPVPGTLTGKGNIYQTTKLLTDPDYVAQLKQFEKNTKNGMLNRKGRFIEGMFIEHNHLNYEHEDGNSYNILNRYESVGVDANPTSNRMARNNSE